MNIGDEMIYTDPKGVERRGLILNTLPCRLMDVTTGETYTGRKFYLWDEQKKRGFWTVGMHQSAPEGARS